MHNGDVKLFDFGGVTAFGSQIIEATRPYYLDMSVNTASPQFDLTCIATSLYQCSHPKSLPISTRYEFDIACKVRSFACDICKTIIESKDASTVLLELVNLAYTTHLSEWKRYHIQSRTLPSPPTNVTVRHHFLPGSVSLSFTAPTNSGAANINIDEYIVISTPSHFKLHVPSAITNVQVTELTPGKALSTFASNVAL